MPDLFITAAEIKALSEEALVTDEVWQEVPGGENIRVGDNEQVDLRKPGNESFYIARKTATKD